MSTTTKTALAAAISVPVLLGPVAAVPAGAETVTTATTAAPADTTAVSDSTITAAGSGTRNARLMAPSRSRSPYQFGSVKYSKWYAYNFMQYKYGWGKSQRSSLAKLWQHESGWSRHAHNGSSGAHGIPQALPGSKMAASGPNWRSNPETQIKWGLSYIKSRYGSPNGAWHAWTSKGWY